MLDRRRILVVDDDPIVRESCRRIFDERGYDIETAATGREGLERVRSGFFNCALVDLRMPDIDGMEVVRGARQHRSGTAVLIITGHGSVSSAAEAARLGVSDYVSKPFTPDEIVRAVDRALSRPPAPLPSDGFERVEKAVRECGSRPEHHEHRAPPDVAEMVARAIGVKKAKAPLSTTFVLGILAGVYIGFGAALATLASHDAAAKVGVGLTQVVSGSVFSVGLMLVVIAGAELFTGNTLMVASVLGREYGMGRLLNRWAVVYAANFAGSLLLALLMYESGLWKMASGAVGARAVQIAVAKSVLPWNEAFFRGIGCNWLVCLAVWMSLSSKDVAGKILAIFFPIMAFLALGYEHCVANMYFIPMGLLLKGTSAAASVAGVESLTWWNFFLANLVPVTLGNIVGGAAFVGIVYWWAYARARR